jgi:hypothetical protein
MNNNYLHWWDTDMWLSHKSLSGLLAPALKGQQVIIFHAEDENEFITMLH